MPQPISQLADYTTITGSAFVPIVDVNETALSKNKKISVDDLREVYFKSGILLSSSFTRHTPGLYYFGDNRDGRLNLTGSIATVRTFVSRSFASTQDGPPVIKNFSSLFISRSVVVSPTNRCRGMLIFVDGDATISGSISMTARGASATGVDASFSVINPPYLGDYWSTQLFPSASYLSRVFAVGASGGVAAPSPAGADGITGINGRSGGGGSGSPFGAPAGSTGGTGTSYSGGAGGGGSRVGSPLAGGNGSPVGGAGGNGVTPAGAGGAGNPAGTGGPVAAAGEGTGGLLILIVRGNLRIGPNGSITANGSAGGSASPSPVAPGGGGGGGSGGGIIYVYYGGTLTNNGTVTATGGSRGTGGNTAGNGGAGTATILRINTAFSVAN